MITKETIREIILENRKQVSNREIVRRDFAFMDNACYVLIGVRRAGKSYILYQIIQFFVFGNGISKVHNFTDNGC